MRKKYFKICFFLLYIFVIDSVSSQTQSNFIDVKEAFLSPQYDAKPWLYWYWMNSTVTKEGIVADLKGFHNVGIGGVIMMDIGNGGNLYNRGDEWFELVHLALTEAKKWGIKVTISSPGWSSSGGPWITPEMSMKELTWSELRVNGNSSSPTILPMPYSNLNYYKDIDVIAFPSPKGDNWLLKNLKPEIVDTTGNVITNTGNLFDNDYGTTTALPVKFDIKFENEIEIRSLLLRALKNNNFKGNILAWNQQENKFIKLAEMKANNAGPFNSQIATSSFPVTLSNRFRIELQNSGTFTEIELSGGYRMTDWIMKAGWGTSNLSQSTKTTSLPSNEDIIPLNKILHLKDKLDSNNKLNWKIPDGDWTILRIGYTTNGIKIYPAPSGGDGLECDKLSKEGTVFNYNKAIKPILEKMGPELSKTLGSHHIDSYEAGGQNWTQNFENEFKVRCGYDIVSYLLALTGRVVESESTSEKFLWDFRHTIGDLFAENHFASAATQGHKDGLSFSNEPYGGPFDNLKCGAAAEYPMDEFWYPATQPKERKLVLPGVNSGHTNNHNILGCESFTSQSPTIRWNEHPYLIKATGDYVFCSGVNRFTFHVSAHQPLIGEHLAPGCSCFTNGLHFDRNTTWWEHGAKEYVGYITRCQSMLQQGEHLADVLYFNGSDSPSNIKPINPQAPVGYDFDVCSEDVLLKIQVKDKLIVLPSGKNYKYLVLPVGGTMTTPLLNKVLNLIKSGANVIGLPVTSSPSLSDEKNTDQQQRTEIIQQLWGKSPQKQGDKIVGTGRIIWGSDFRTILDKDQLIPDFNYSTQSNLLINYIHRYTKTSEIYFVANGKQKAGWVSCRFRVKDMIPEFYKPYEGTIESCPTYKSVGNYMEIPIWFDQSGSVFVVFHKSENKGPFVVSKTDEPVELAKLPFTEPWQIHFPQGWGAPEAIEFPKLISYTDHQNEGVRYFSGTAEYNTTIDVPQKIIVKNSSIYLDLGEVNVIAEVKINGKNLGTYWKPPFKIDVTSAIKSGVNLVQVSVTNLWPNRLIGDEIQFPAGKFYDKEALTYFRNWTSNTTNPLPDPNRFTFTTFRAWSKDDKLLPSGLIGPVTLSVVKSTHK